MMADIFNMRLTPGIEPMELDDDDDSYSHYTYVELLIYKDGKLL